MGVGEVRETLISDDTVFAVYGNHGVSPTQLDDLLSYISECFLLVGKNVYFTEHPVAGSLNILIEHFSEADVTRVRDCLDTPGTRFVCIATEFLTGTTFNHFRDTAEGENPPPNEPTLTPYELKRARKNRGIGGLIRRSLKMAFHRRKTTEANPTPRFDSYYDDASYWQNRYDRFAEIVEACDRIWCIAPEQLDAYSAAWGEKVALLPLAPTSPTCHASCRGRFVKDIDFFFSGSVTRHRRVILDALRAAGKRVVIANSMLSSVIRENVVARSKVCLHIRQNTSWRYPSAMRLHYFLVRGATVVAEQAHLQCVQEDFVVSASTEAFVEAALAAVADAPRSPAEIAAAYYEATESNRAAILSELSAVLANPPPVGAGSVRDGLDRTSSVETSAP